MENQETTFILSLGIKIDMCEQLHVDFDLTWFPKELMASNKMCERRSVHIDVNAICHILGR